MLRSLSDGKLGRAFDFHRKIRKIGKTYVPLAARPKAATNGETVGPMRAISLTEAFIGSDGLTVRRAGFACARRSSPEFLLPDLVIFL